MYKDTAKWLLAFVPITTLASIAVALAPNIDVVRAGGLGSWVSANWVLIIAVAVVAIAGVTVTALCAVVLLAGPSTWKTVREDTTWLSNAFSVHAVGRPYFLDSTTFIAAEDRAISGGVKVSAADREVVAKVTMRVLELSTTLNEKARFKRFVLAYVIGAVAILAGTATALVASPEDTIVSPERVDLLIPDAFEEAFVTDSGCATVAETEAIAVGGTLDSPILRLYGTGCTTEEWSPPESMDLQAVPA